MKHLLPFVVLCTAILSPFFLSGQNTAATSQDILTGRIINEAGEPLAGALIKIDGTESGTVTGPNGRFNMEHTEAFPFSITVSYLGYVPKTIEVQAQRPLEISLAAKAEELSEIVVVGYGTQSRRQLTSAVVSADETAYEGLPAQTIESGLQGRLPGVVFSPGSGALGVGQSIRVRGAGSINAGNQPLIVVDGLIYSGLDVFLFGGGGSATNPLLNLNPADVASVEVLKDGAASAIYGSRGGNGVIIITTKKGSLNSQPKVRVSSYIGYSEPSRRYEVLDGKEYASLWNRAARAVGLDESSGLIYDVGSQPSTDWFGLVTRRGLLQETSASVSGGTNTTRYYFGGTYRDEESYYLATYLKRYSFRASIEQEISSKLRAGMSVNPSQVHNDMAGEGFSFLAPNSLSNSFPPNVRAFDENGEPKVALFTDIGRGGVAQNAYINLLESDNRMTSTQVLFNTFIDYTPLPNLTLRSEFGTEFTQLEHFFKNSSRTTFGFGRNGEGYAASNQLLNYNWTLQGGYQWNAGGRYQADFSLGANFTGQSFTGQSSFGIDYADDRLRYLNAASTITSSSSFRTDNTFAGFFGRANFAFSNKYLFTLSGRLDGSSRFSRENRFGFFPALSAGWIISEEPFFNDNTLQFLKLRASIGVSGNAAIDDFAYRSAVDFDNTYGGEPGALLVELENEELGWEKIRQFDIGLDFNFWEGRFSGTLDYFIKETRDLLLQFPLPGTSGFTTSLQNVGALRNRGLEFELSAELLRGPVQWSLSLNGATLHNEITELVDTDNDGRDEDIITGKFIFRAGESIASWYLVHYAGVDPSNGDALFLDEEGGTVPVSPPLSARVIAGKTLPELTAGITNRFAFKGFGLSFLLYYAGGHQLYREAGEAFETNMLGQINQLKSQLNAWTPDNPDTDIPEARLGQPNGSQPFTTRYLDDADFIRLRNLQLSYTFSGLGKRAGRLRLYLSGQNLFLITGYEGLDPEASRGPADAPQWGRTYANSPQARTILFGIDFTY